MSLEKPYEFIQSGRMLFIFTTDNSVDYKVEFVQDKLNFDSFLLVFEMQISVDGSKNNLNPSLDRRVEITIVEILREIFSSNNNSVVYVCDNNDNRQHTRKRKFDSWFNKYKTTEIEKQDSDFKFKGKELLTSLIIHQNNPLKKIIIDLFVSQKDQLDK